MSESTVQGRKAAMRGGAPGPSRSRASSLCATPLRQYAMRAWGSARSNGQAALKPAHRHLISQAFTMSFSKPIGSSSAAAATEPSSTSTPQATSANISAQPPGGLAARGRLSDATAGRLAVLGNSLRATIDTAVASPQQAPLPTVGEFLNAPLPASRPKNTSQGNPLFVAELQDLITQDLGPRDIRSLSLVNRRLRHDLGTPIAQRRAAMQNAMAMMLRANNGRSSGEDLYHAPRVVGFRAAVELLRQAFNLPAADSATKVLTEYVRHLGILPHARGPRQDAQYQATYLARSLLRRFANPNRAELNRLAETALNVLPELWEGRHMKPGHYGGKAFEKVMTSAGNAGDATCGVSIVAGLPIAIAAGPVAAALSVFIKKDKTANRTINLALEAMKKAGRGHLDDALVQRVADLLVAAPGGKGSHLRDLRDALKTQATAAQLAAVQPRLQAADWLQATP